MAPIALILLARSEGRSYAQAGVAAGAFGLGSAAGAAVLGRACDRHGLRAALPPAAAGAACALAGLALAGPHAALLVLLLLAATSGIAMPPIGAAMRALWPSLVSDRLSSRRRAFATEAAVQEVAFVLGPVLVTLLVTTTSARVSILAIGLVALLGTLAFVALAPPSAGARGRSADTGGKDGGSRPAARTRQGAGVYRVVLITFLFGAGAGALEVAVPAFADDHQRRAIAGLLLACLAAGSLLGGLATSAVRGSAVRRYRAALALFALAIAPLLLPRSIWLMAVLLLVAGTPIAMSFASAYSLLDALAPPARAVETFAWGTSATTVGIAAGNAAGGLATHTFGYRASIGIAACIELAASVVTHASRRELEPGDRTNLPGATQ